MRKANASIDLWQIRNSGCRADMRKSIRDKEMWPSGLLERRARACARSHVTSRRLCERQDKYNRYRPTRGQDSGRGQVSRGEVSRMAPIHWHFVPLYPLGPRLDLQYDLTCWLYSVPERKWHRCQPHRRPRRTQEPFQARMPAPLPATVRAGTSES